MNTTPQAPRPRRRLWPGKLLAALALLLACATALVGWLNVRGEEAIDATMPAHAPTADQVARGAYLARIGNCAGCHTDRGGAPFAGGRAIETPFGTLYGSNLTPHPSAGIGNWSPDHFWRALHHGRARDGRLLYPAFPYTEFTHVSRADADALYAYLRSLPAVDQPNRAHTLRFPYNTQAALAVWRALFFRAGGPVDDPAHTADWSRGAYLVRGLGHCQACHAPRNALGASSTEPELAGGLIPVQRWYAPSLAAPEEAGMQAWPLDAIVRLLREGRAPQGAVSGPMAEVVFNSTQYLSDADARAMAAFLQSLPMQHRTAESVAPVAHDVFEQGEKLYAAACAECHGKQGEGWGMDYPALAGRRSVVQPVSAHLVQKILHGGFAPATAGNPRPYGMPPFGARFSDAQVAALASYVRMAWGNHAGAVSELEVAQLR